MNYIKEKVLTFIYFYRVIFITSSVIAGLVVILQSSTINLSLLIVINYATFGFIGSVLLNHYFNKRRYTFYRNQGLKVKFLYIMALVSNIIISLLLGIILGFLWQI